MDTIAGYSSSLIPLYIEVEGQFDCCFYIYLLARFSSCTLCLSPTYIYNTRKTQPTLLC